MKRRLDAVDGSCHGLFDIGRQHRGDVGNERDPRRLTFRDRCCPSPAQQKPCVQIVTGKRAAAGPDHQGLRILAEGFDSGDTGLVKGIGE
ncbi:hypothetical protein [Candidatus Mycolicibacterium alkanivorans]|uniref:Uncharacterized protein n=1 Tax=Candidatus Mycolicibacterium alkanivorans TaxID=2954114 RepID=A0ABS9YWW8_9MYCO|nr:hypothetical protein [Candidatus Mycolicibacterium alkanivorans]MCI4675334.1 hypothetical protein [Candidatus Mycolicibacterium alkanivorans]